jgi:hypothetical protein
MIIKLLCFRNIEKDKPKICQDIRITCCVHEIQNHFSEICPFLFYPVNIR